MKFYKANNGKKKISAVAICLLLTVVMAVGGTLAYLFTNTQSVTNTFKPAQAPNEIQETMNTDKTVKSDVYISVPQNEKNVKVYIRVAMVATWQNSAGEIASVTPVAGTDYIIDAGSSKWVKHTDGFYYYKEIVAPGGQTEKLFDSITVVDDKAPAGYTLHVELLSQSIQAEGTDASGKTPIEIAWKVKISGDTVTTVS